MPGPASPATAAAMSADDRLDRVYQALANRTRRALIAMLAAGPARVTDLARPFGISLNAVSKHLAVLERAGLLTRTVSGRVHSCKLEAAPMADAERWLRGYEAFWTGQLDSFARYVENEMD